MRNLIFLILFFPVILLSQNRDQVQRLNLPENFPVPEVLVVNNPSPGYFFISPGGLFGFFQEATPYLIILDNHGTPIFFQEHTRSVFDFKLQTDGTLSFAHGTMGYKHYLLDDKWQFIKETGAAGDQDDFHDFVILENGNYLTLATEYRIVDMSQLVPGGHQDVAVAGAKVRIQDPGGAVLFEWSSFDHIPITDAGENVDLTDPDFIDYIHVNSVEQDSDTSLVISARNTHDVTRINLLTGQVIWRMGGKKNQFTFENDSCIFYAQHDARYHGNNIYSVFDNNWQVSIPDESRFIMYQLDEVNKTATVLKDIRSRPVGIMGGIMGNGQVLENGNILVGWGSGSPNFTEFHPDGSKAFEVDYEAVSYRAFKFDWKPQAITFDKDTADFGKVSVSVPTSRKYTIFNNCSQDMVINYVHHHKNEFSLETEIPFTISKNSSAEVVLSIDPQGNDGLYEDLFTFCADTKTDGLNQRIGGQLKIKAIAETGIGLAEHSFHQIRLYPNPIDEKITIGKGEFKGLIQKVVLRDQFGRTLEDRKVTGSQSVTLTTTHLASGIYLLVIHTNLGLHTRKLLKH